MNLFEIQAKLDNIFNQVIENEGELDESLASELEIAQEELDDKLYAYSFVIDRYSSDIALLKQYKKALDDRIARFEKNQDKLKDAIAEAVYKYGDPVVKKIKIQVLKKKLELILIKLLLLLLMFVKLKLLKLIMTYIIILPYRLSSISVIIPYQICQICPKLAHLRPLIYQVD